MVLRGLSKAGLGCRPCCRQGPADDNSDGGSEWHPLPQACLWPCLWPALPACTGRIENNPRAAPLSHRCAALFVVRRCAAARGSPPTPDNTTAARININRECGERGLAPMGPAMLPRWARHENGRARLPLRRRRKSMDEVRELFDIFFFRIFVYLLWTKFRPVAQKK